MLKPLRKRIISLLILVKEKIIYSIKTLELYLPIIDRKIVPQTHKIHGSLERFMMITQLSAIILSVIAIWAVWRIALSDGSKNANVQLHETISGLRCINNKIDMKTVRHNLINASFLKQDNSIERVDMQRPKKKRKKNLGNNITIVHFWASWCKGCAEELLDLDKASESQGDLRYKILPISIDQNDPFKAVQNFYEANNILSLPIIVDTNGEFFRLMNKNVIPSSLIVQNGVPIGYIFGSIEWTAPSTIEFLSNLDSCSEFEVIQDKSFVVNARK